ncbi:Uncharacterized protein M6B38_238480 [Iris pallida]|uniref:Uncharacterized protein n=1 Tax=Iris pallida TaxID=29817 RepID=A0AAX6DLJ3_IRIPA|nr:Uncharacterized protein M6B38_238480 [Iris pallida]
MALAEEAGKTGPVAYSWGRSADLPGLSTATQGLSGYGLKAGAGGAAGGGRHLEGRRPLLRQGGGRTALDAAQGADARIGRAEAVVNYGKCGGYEGLRRRLWQREARLLQREARLAGIWTATRGSAAVLLRNRRLTEFCGDGAAEEGRSYGSGSRRGVDAGTVESRRRLGLVFFEFWCVLGLYPIVEL